MLDHVEFETWLNEHYRSMYRLAYRLVNQYEDAEEIVQEAFLKAWVHRRNFRNESSIHTWIYRIVVNTALSFKRRMKRHRRKLTAFFVEMVPGSVRSAPRMEQHIYRIEMSQRLNEALQQLPETLRAIVILRDIEGLAYEDIAVILGLPVGTVKSRLWRARFQLRKEFEDILQAEHPRDTETRRQVKVEAATVNQPAGKAFPYLDRGVES